MLGLKEPDRLEQEATPGEWQRSRFVDGSQYRKMPAAWKESRREEEQAIVRGPGVVGTADCNIVLAFRYGAAQANMDFIVAARNQLRPMLPLLAQMGEALEDAVKYRQHDLHTGMRLEQDALAAYRKAQRERA